MKKLQKITALLLAFIVAMSATAFAADDLYSSEPTENELFDELLTLYLDNHLANRPKADVLEATINELLEAHPYLFYDIATALIESGDEYSFYETPEMVEFFDSLTYYGGIGISVVEDAGELFVTSVTPSSPAQIAGIETDDVVVAIDNFPMAGLTAYASSLLGTGEVGSEITVTVRRGGQTLDYTMTRTEISEKVIDSAVIDDNILYVKISSFTSDDFLNQFVTAIEPILYDENENLDRMILDLRDNSGGTTYNMLDTINYLIPESGVKMLSIEDKDGKVLAEYETTGRGIDLENIVILVNGDSYSASEAVAYTLHELGYATTVGTVTGGKAVGQYIFPLSDGSIANITSLVYKSPNGNTYNEVGVTPDYIVQNTPLESEFPAMNVFNHDNYTECVYGAQNEVVRALSQRINHLGLTTGVTDLFDDSIKTALTIIQRFYGMPETGELDLETFQRITDDINVYKEIIDYKDDQLDKAIEEVKKDRN